MSLHLLSVAHLHALLALTLCLFLRSLSEQFYVVNNYLRVSVSTETSIVDQRRDPEVRLLTEGCYWLAYSLLIKVRDIVKVK